MKFIRSSIINFDSKLIKPDLETSKTYYGSIKKLGNFSKKTIFNKLTNEKFPNLSIPLKLIDRFIDISKKVTTNKKLRTLKELRYLLNFLYEKKIKLFLGIDIKNHNQDFVGAAYLNQRFIVLNVEEIFDIDYLCETLTHELIHFLQNDRPLYLDIDDSVVPFVMEKYNHLDSFDLQQELEAYTYENCPNFIENFNKNKFNLKEIFYPSNQRNFTINWITLNKKLPNYSQSSKPPYQYDLRKNVLDNYIISDLRPEKIYFPNRLMS